MLHFKQTDGWKNVLQIEEDSKSYSKDVHALWRTYLRIYEQTLKQNVNMQYVIKRDVVYVVYVQTTIGTCNWIHAQTQVNGLLEKWEMSRLCAVLMSVNTTI